MSEHFDEQISEFIDDEMSAGECEFFVRRLQRDEAARGRYLRYQLIGAAMRGEHLQHNASELQGRLARALAEDAASSSETGRGIVGTRLVAGAGIAAGLLLFAAIGFGIAELGRFPGSDTEDFSASATKAPSMVATPARSGDAGAFAGSPSQVTGIQYLLHHTVYSSGLNRTIMQSGLVAAREDAESTAGEADPVD
jgi:sigma-E factor negative regulatory protein RseA